MSIKSSITIPFSIRSMRSCIGIGLYGKRGFFQYQCVVPFEHGYEIMHEIMLRIARSGEGSFVTVLKKFGDVASPGYAFVPATRIDTGVGLSQSW